MKLPWLTYTPRGRLPQLDALRGLAILLVLGNHAVVEPSNAGALAPLAGWWMRFGWTGVDLFFVLSGFLISGLLFSEIQRYGKLNVGQFLIRRGFKIWPTYVVFILFVLAGYLMKHWEAGPAYAFHALMPNFLHIQSYVLSPRVHTWTLAVEEHFYLALPLLLHLLLLRSKNSRTALSVLPALAVTVMLVCLAMRIHNSHVEPFSYLTHQYATHLRFDSLFWGVFLGYLHHFLRAFDAYFKRWRWALSVLGLALLSPMFVLELESSRFVQSYGFSLLSLGYGCLLMAMLSVNILTGDRPLRRGAAWMVRAMAFVGYYSYSIYIWHVDLAGKPMHVMLQKGLLAPMPPAVGWAVAALMFLLLSVGSGLVMARLIELPALRLRDRLFPSRSAAPT